MAAAGAELDGFGELEILHAGLEAWLGMASVDDGVDEIFFDRPGGFEFGRDGQHTQFLFAPARAEDFVFGEVVNKRTVAAVEGQRFVGRELRDAAPLQAAGESVRPLAEDLHEIGDMHHVAFAFRHGDFHLRVNAARHADPFFQHLGVDAHGEHVDAAEFRALPPMGWCERIGKRIAIGDQAEVVKLARITVVQQLLEKFPALHAVRRGTKHRDQLRARLRGGEHLAALTQIHRHARLTEDMLAGLERRDGDRRVQDRRGTDPDDVEIGPVEHLCPVVEDIGDAELLRNLLRRLRTRIADGDDLHVGQRLQAGQVPLPDDAARADDADAQFL